MLTKRLIACFDVVDGRVTKAQQFQDNIDVAPAEELAQQLYDDQIDEIVFYDITRQRASGARSISTPCARVAQHVFVPVHRRRRHPLGRRHVRGAQGGRREDQRRLDGRAQPRHHPQGAEAFGRQCIVLSTQVKHVGMRDGIPSGLRGLHRRRARRRPASTPLDWVRRGEDLGAGEIVVNSIDRDGTASGYDLDITRAVADAVNVPVIASGGAGTVEHIADGLTAGGAQAAIISSILYSPRLRAEPRRARAEGRRSPSAVCRCAPTSTPERAAHRARDASIASTRRVGPQAVEVVVGARLVEEHVHDDVAEVEQHPRRVVESLDADRASTRRARGARARPRRRSCAPGACSTPRRARSSR